MIRALAVALLLAGCATDQAVTVPVTPGVCHVEVSFGSYAMGVDHDLRTRILAVIEADEDVLDVQERRWGREGEILACPWHGWEFDLLTGESLSDPRIRLRRYPVEVEDDTIYITL